MFYLLASDDTDGLKPTPENLPDIEEALDDLNDDPNMGSFGSGPYWPKIREQLLKNSNSQDPKEAVAEWKYVRMWIDWGKCELCDHNPIKYHFQIENRINGNRLVLGSECIFNYLTIPGVPSKEVLKKRLNQLRSTAKAVAMGKLEGTAVQELEQIQSLEREVNMLIHKVSRPAKDIDIREYRKVLEEPVGRLGLLGANSQGVKTVQDILTATRQLQGHLEQIQRRSTKYKSFLLLPAVEAIMRFRDLGERRSALEATQKYITNAFKLGESDQAVEMAWAEVRGMKKDVIATYLAALDTAKMKAQDQYTGQLEQLKPYSHLSFLVQAGVNLIKSSMDKEANGLLAVLEKIDGEGHIDRYYLSPWKLKGPTVPSLQSLSNTVAQEAHRVLDVLRQVSPATDLAYYVAKKYGLAKVTDIAGITKAVLEAMDDGDLDNNYLGVQVEKNPKLQARLAEEVDDIKNSLRATEGLKVWEAMSEQLNFDVKKFYGHINTTSGDWIKSFAKSIFQQWQRGLKGLTYKQRAVVDKNLGPNNGEGRSLWDEMAAEFNKPYEPPTRFASDEEPDPVYAYGR